MVAPLQPEMQRVCTDHAAGARCSANVSGNGQQRRRQVRCAAVAPSLETICHSRSPSDSRLPPCASIPRTRSDPPSEGSSRGEGDAGSRRKRSTRSVRSLRTLNVFVNYEIDPSRRGNPQVAGSVAPKLHVTLPRGDLLPGRLDAMPQGTSPCSPLSLPQSLVRRWTG